MPAHAPQGAGVVPFQHRKGRHAENKQRTADDKHQLAVDTEPPEIPDPGDLLPDEEAQTAQNHQRHQGQTDDIVRIVTHDAGAGVENTHDIKARVAEGGHRMEYAPAKRPLQSHIRPEPEHEDQRADELNGQAALEHHLLQIDHGAHVIHAQRLSHDQPLLHAHSAAQEEHKDRGRGHKTQTADLNETQNHRLPEAAPLAPCVKESQTRDTGGGGGGEQRSPEGTGNTASGSGGRHQQRGSQGDDQRKYARDQPGGADLCQLPVAPSVVNKLPSAHGRPSFWILVYISPIIPHYNSPNDFCKPQRETTPSAAMAW